MPSGFKDFFSKNVNKTEFFFGGTQFLTIFVHFLICFVIFHKNYFIIIHFFICKKWLHSFPEIFVISDLFEVKISKVIFFAFLPEKHTGFFVHCRLFCFLHMFTWIFDKFIFKSCSFHNCFKYIFVNKWTVIS